MCTLAIAKYEHVRGVFASTTVYFQFQMLMLGKHNIARTCITYVVILLCYIKGHDSIGDQYNHCHSDHHDNNNNSIVITVTIHY